MTRLLPKKYFKEPTRPKSREVRSPACEVLGAAVKDLGAQNFFGGDPGYRAPFLKAAALCEKKVESYKM